MYWCIRHTARRKQSPVLSVSSLFSPSPPSSVLRLSPLVRSETTSPWNVVSMTKKNKTATTGSENGHFSQPSLPSPDQSEQVPSTHFLFLPPGPQVRPKRLPLLKKKKKEKEKEKELALSSLLLVLLLSPSQAGAPQTHWAACKHTKTHTH